MKLSTVQRAELKMMSRYFASIEKIADRMGIEVDALFEEFMHHGLTYGSLKQNLLAVASNRREIFSRHGNRLRNSETSIVNLAVLVNEDRF